MDVETQSCVIINPSDTNFDGCVSMTDLLDLLSVFGTCNEVPWSCGDPLEYQGYDYETVLIGEQCWFAENCRFMPFVGGGFQEEPSVLVYGYDGDSVEEAQETLTYDMYGALYNYASATQLGLCPQAGTFLRKLSLTNCLPISVALIRRTSKSCRSKHGMSTLILLTRVFIAACGLALFVIR